MQKVKYDLSSNDAKSIMTSFPIWTSVSIVISVVLIALFICCFFVVFKIPTYRFGNYILERGEKGTIIKTDISIIKAKGIKEVDKNVRIYKTGVYDGYMICQADSIFVDNHKIHLLLENCNVSNRTGEIAITDSNENLCNKLFKSIVK
jgi:hypothetical protein